MHSNDDNDDSYLRPIAIYTHNRAASLVAPMAPVPTGLFSACLVSEATSRQLGDDFVSAFLRQIEGLSFACRIMCSSRSGKGRGLVPTTCDDLPNVNESMAISAYPVRKRYQGSHGTRSREGERFIMRFITRFGNCARSLRSTSSESERKAG